MVTCSSLTGWRKREGRNYVVILNWREKKLFIGGKKRSYIAQGNPPGHVQHVTFWIDVNKYSHNIHNVRELVGYAEILIVFENLKLGGKKEKLRKKKKLDIA